MGEIADMMIDGILCEERGIFIDDNESEEGGPGYPRICDNCSKPQHNCDK